MSPPYVRPLSTASQQQQQQQQQQQRFYSHSPWISYIIPCLQFLGKLGRALRITKGLDNRRARR